MFSGIVQKTGKIISVTQHDKVKTARLKLDNIEMCKIGDSVALNGVCLTVTAIDAETCELSFDIVPETLRKTNLTHLEKGSLVNVEFSLRYGDFVGGHFVQGHVEGIGSIRFIRCEGNARVIGINADRELLKAIINKGFITIDGMSITVIECLEDYFTVTLIPHTLDATIAKEYQIGQNVNLETDPLGRYVYAYTEKMHLVS